MVLKGEAMIDPKSNINVDGPKASVKAHKTGAIPMNSLVGRRGSKRVETEAALAGAHLKGGDPHSVANLNKRLNRNRNIVSSTLIGALVVAIFVIGGIFYWINRPVNITVNGKTVALKSDSPVTDAFQDAEVKVSAGKLLAVDGSTIQEDGGWAFSAKVNGQDLSSQDAQNYKIKAGDTIEISNGADKTEDYDVVGNTEVAPKLEMDGNAGSIGYIAQWGYAGKSETRKGKTSGITTDVETQKVQNVVVKLHTPHPSGDQKLVALTFDDGPSSYTQRYIDILKQFNAKATFFNVGNYVQQSPDLSKAIIDAGMQLANHTQSHILLSDASATDAYNNINDGFNSIKNATGLDTTVLRAPYGAFRQSTWLKSGGLVSYNVLWSQDSQDWERPGADAIVNNALAGVTSGSIILFHDGGGNRDQDVEALPKILKTLSDEGYKFVTVNELLASDPEFPQELSSGNMKMPEDSVWPTELQTN